MKDDRILIMLRDDIQDQGCIEYSWIPSGQREHVFLAPGEQQVARTSSRRTALGVQVYVLTQGVKSLVEWQFPEVGEKQMLSAVISVRAGVDIVEAVAFYADGTRSVHKTMLERERRKCPSGIE